MLLAALDVLKPEPGLAFWTVVTFAVLLVVLRLVAWKPILEMVEQREKTIKDALDAAKVQQEEAARLAAEQKTAAEAARKDTAELIRKNQLEIAAAKEQLMAAARKESDALLAGARKTIEEETAKARVELKNLAVDLAMAAAAKLVATQMDPAKQRALVQEYIEKLPAASV